MSSYSSGNKGTIQGSYTYCYFNATASLSGDYPNIVQTVNWELGIYCSGNSSYNSNSNQLTVNGTNAWSGGWNVGKGSTAIASGSYSNALGNAQTLTSTISWSFMGQSGSGSLADGMSMTGNYHCDSPTNIGPSSATVTCRFTQQRNYYRYYLYDVNSGKTWYSDNPQTADGQQLSISGLSPNTNYKISLKCLDRNGNIVATGTTYAEFTTLGYSTATLSNSNANIGSSITINTNRYSSSFTHTITYACGSASGTVGTGIGASTSWTIPTSLYSQLSNVTSKSCTLTTKTYSGSTLIGTTTTTFNVCVPSSIVPSISNIEVTDASTQVQSAYTSYVVRYLSKKTVKVTCSAGTGSSIKSVNITFGSSTITATLSGSTYVATFSNISSAELSVKVEDQRSRTASSPKSGLTYLAYDYPSITKLTASRTSETSSNGTCEYSASYSTVGSNAISSATLTCSNGSSTSLSGSSGSVSGSQSYTNLDHSKSYTFTLSIKDKIWTGTASTTFTLAQGQPTLWLGRDNAKIYGNSLGIASGLMNSHIYPNSGGNTNVWYHLCDIDCRAHRQGEFIALRVYLANGQNGKYTDLCYYDLTGQLGWNGDTGTNKGGRAGWVAEFNPMRTGLTYSSYRFVVLAPSNYQYQIYLIDSEVAYTAPNVVILCGNDNLITFYDVKTTTAPSGIECEITHHDIALNSYPVGSIYMSVNSTSPATLFGGTWEQLTDRFLIGAGSSYSNGSTGGSTSHTHTTSGHALTVSEMPSHNHAVTTYNNTGNITNPATNLKLPSGYGAATSGTGYTVLNTSSTGSGSSHSHGNTGSTSNMPPYLAVYMWKRTA